MSDLPLGNVPSSVLDDSDNIIFAEGQLAKKITYGEMKTNMLGSAPLTTAAPKTKESINELNQDIMDIGGYGVISGGIVSAQATPNMTVQATACTLRTSTGARQIASANASLTVTTADTTNARIDIVYVDSTGAIQYLQGTASSIPVAPTTPTEGQLLAQINVSANATTITNAIITDKRKILISTDWLNAQLSENTQNIATNAQNITKNAQDIASRPIMTTANITYYISTSGSDTTGDGTSGKPFKTIQYAINKLPQIINHNVNINVASGTYNETISINGFNGKGSLYINGTSTDTNVSAVIASSSTLDLKISNFQITTTTASSILCNIVKRLSIINCNLVSDGKTSGVRGVETIFSDVYIGTSTISNKLQAINSGYGSIILSVGNSGTNNTTGLISDYGGTICKSGTQPTGTTNEVTANGGVIR